MTYAAPIKDMRFILEEMCDLDGLATLPGLEEATRDTVAAVLDEAAKYAADVLLPLNQAGDVQGLGFDRGRVTTPKGWKAAYQQLVEGGWNAPTAAPEFGGMGLPHAVNACIQEMFQGANMSFQLCPMLTQGAIEALEGYASDALKHTYLHKLVSGEWTGTMNLTEPQAGSDLAAIQTRAKPNGDHYLIRGQKIYITYGAHDLTDNIIHLVLARLPDGPPGVKGISLFLVPQVMLTRDGAMGLENDVRCVSIEHKLGIHASPTCTLTYGDHGGAVGYLVGEPHKGLQYMFTMMNNARLNVGLQGVGVAEHAYQTALAYARDRKQGKPAGLGGPDTIIGHGDIRRMLGTMRAQIFAARALYAQAATALDHAARNPDAAARATHQARVDLLIPVVKGWSTEMAVDVASLGIQVHGGMGYVEETGAAQHLRDARITTIYEGTTGIQALDLVGRKILRDEGAAVDALVAEIRSEADRIKATVSNQIDWAGLAGMVRHAADLVNDMTGWLLTVAKSDPVLQNAAAVNMLHGFGVALGAWQIASAAHRAGTGSLAGTEEAAARLQLAEIYRGQVFPMAQARRDAVIAGTAGVKALRDPAFG